MTGARTVVVGGGIIGLSVAWELARRGEAVLVLDAGSGNGAATWAAAGMLAPVSEVEIEGPELLRLGLDSLHRYPQFVREVESASGTPCGLRTEGTLWVALDRDQAGEIEHLRDSMRARGVDAEPLSAAEVMAREPHLSGRVVGGMAVPGDLQVDPRALAAALRRAIESRGGRVEPAARVESIDAGGGVLRIVGACGGAPIETLAERVVVAAGAWSGLGGLLPLDGLHLRPVKGQIVRLSGEALLRHVVRTPEVYLVPRAHGELVVGATIEEQGFCTNPTAGAVLDLLRHAWRIVPGIYDLPLSEVSVGLRPALPDHLPAIGPTAVPGLFLAVGHFRNGILLAPATAQLLADAMEGAAPPELRPFLPARLELAPHPAAP